MSHKQKMVELRQQLEKWKSHNEVHAKPADEMLYQFLNSLLNLANGEESEEEVGPASASTPLAATNDEDTGDSGPGGNTPPPPDIP